MSHDSASGDIAKSANNTITPSQCDDIEAEKFDHDENTQLNPKNKDQCEYKLYGFRHIELALYCMASITNQMTWISLQPVAGAIENGYGYGPIMISSLGITYMVVFVLINYPSNILIDKGGLRVAVYVGMALTTLGTIIKCFVNQSFTWVIIGQVCAAFGQPLLAIAPAKLATYWYGQNERVIATTVATAAQPIGVAFGFVFPTIFVKADDADPGEQNEENARKHIFQSQFWQAIIACFLFVLILIFFKEKPNVPPSAAVAAEGSADTM